MKNNKITLLLSFLVLIVWGVIIYKIIKASTGEENIIKNAPSNSPREIYNDYTFADDTTHLQLNYRDPFGLIKFKDTTKVFAKRIAVTKSKTTASITNWSFVVYTGFIKNPTSKKLIALLTINGKNFMMTEGEIIENLQLLKNMRDSVKVAFKGSTKYLTMHAEKL